MAATKYQPGADYMQNLNEGPRRFPALYYFPGTGPKGETCASCAAFLTSSKKSRGRCAKWAIHRGRGDQLEARQRGDGPDWWRGLPCVDSDTPACKYWSPDEATAEAMP